VQGGKKAKKDDHVPRNCVIWGFERGVEKGVVGVFGGNYQGVREKREAPLKWERAHYALGGEGKKAQVMLRVAGRKKAGGYEDLPIFQSASKRRGDTGLEGGETSVKEEDWKRKGWGGRDYSGRSVSFYLKKLLEEGMSGGKRRLSRNTVREL